MKRVIGKHDYNYIIIAGCSRLGSNIASTLSNQGKYVVIIDEDESSFRKLSANYSGFTIVGDAADMDILKEAGIEKADLLLATTNDDNTNIMISTMSKSIFSVPKVVSRIYDVNKEVIYKDFDINTIRPFELSINEFERFLID